DFRDLLGDRSPPRLVVDQLQITDQFTGVVGGVLHRNHPRSLFSCVVLDHRLVHLRFDIANHQAVEQLLGIGLVQIVPVMLELLIRISHQRNQLLHCRLLRHGIDELVRDHGQTVDATFEVGVEHDLDTTDQVVDRRLFTQVADRSNNIATKVAEECRTLGANHAEIDLHALLAIFRHVLDQGLEQVGIQTTAQTTVTAHHHIAGTLDFALDHEGMAVFRVGVGQMTNHLADTLRVGTASSHALLSLAHLADRHFFHGAGDLLRAFDARNLAANLFCACHFTPIGLAGGRLATPAAAYQVWVALNFSIPALMAASISSLKSPFTLILAIRSARSRLK